MNTNGLKAHAVIVVAGFAGLACARKLARKDDVWVTLIDKNNYHQFQPLLYQLATGELGTGDVATSIRQAFRGRANVDVKMTEVTAVNPGPPGIVKKLHSVLNSAGVGDDDIRTEEFAGY